MTDQEIGDNFGFATYVGGPLAGLTVAASGARHPIYRSDKGTPLSPEQGEWISWSSGGDAVRLRVRHYAHREIIEDCIVRHFYVHATVLAQWENERRAKRHRSLRGPVGFQKSACPSDLRGRCARPFGHDRALCRCDCST